MKKTMLYLEKEQHDALKRLSFETGRSMSDYFREAIADLLEKMGGEAVEQSSHYEQAGDQLTGDRAVRAYRAAQDHLNSESKSYMADVNRLQAKIIAALEGRPIN